MALRERISDFPSSQLRSYTFRSRPTTLTPPRFSHSSKHPLQPPCRAKSLLLGGLLLEGVDRRYYRIPPPVREWVLGRNGQISLTGGGMLFSLVSSFLPTFLTIFSIFSCENVLKRFFGLPPSPPTCRHPPPTPYTPPVGLPSQISFTGGQPKKGPNLSYWGGGGVSYWGYTVCLLVMMISSLDV